MCLAVPGRILSWIDRDPTFGRAEIEFAGVHKICHMACVPDVQEGDYVLVHAGIAIARIATDEALRTLADLQRLAIPDDESEAAV